MSSVRSKFLLFLNATGLVLIVAMSASSQESRPQRGRAIEFSEPRSNMVISNANDLRANKTTLKRFEWNLKKPLELFSPGAALTDRFTASPAPRSLTSTAKGRQVKELLKKRNEWIFLAPEDYFPAGWTVETMFDLPEYGPGGEEKKKKTPMERYYERLDSTRVELRAATDQVGGSGPQDPRQNEERSNRLNELAWGEQLNPLSYGLSDMEQTMKRLSAGDSSGFGTVVIEPAATSSSMDLFGFGKRATPKAATDKFSAMEARKQEFKQLLETRSVMSGNAGTHGYNPLIGSVLPAAPPVASTGLEGLNPNGSWGGGRLQSPNPVSQSSLPGMPTTAARFDAPSWQTTIAAPEPPPVTLPPPTVNIPQRKF